MIEQDNYNIYLSQLKAERAGLGKQKGRAPKPTNGFRKYNGERFSKEMTRALNEKRITQDAFKKIIFRKGNINEKVFHDYVNTFR